MRNWKQYGNEVDLNYAFSAAAILVVIPGSIDRIALRRSKAHNNVPKTDRAAFPFTSSGPEKTPTTSTASVGAQDEEKSVGLAEMTPASGESA